MTTSPPVAAVLTDVEGTTTDVRFVHDVLFPRARAAMPAFVAAHPEHPGVRAVRADLAAEHGRDADAVPLGRVAEVFQRWIDEDRKDTRLKAVQGALWREAYESGAVRGHVYPDVVPAFRRWRAAGRALYVFSSGSVEAQELLFRHSVAGDLTPYLAGYFDTATGPKRAAESYARIARAIGQAPAAVRFLSDVVAELDAARGAGMQTVLLVRPGAGVCAETSGHAAAPDFDAVD